MKNILLKLALIISSLDAYSNEASSPILNNLIESSYQNNPTLRVLQKEIEITANEADIVAAIADPTISYNYFLFPIETRKGAQHSNLMLSQAIPWPSKLEALRKKTLLSKEEKTEKLKLEKLYLKAKVSISYYQAVLNKSLIEANEKHLTLLKELKEIIVGKIKVDKARQIDLINLNLQYQKLSGETITLKSELDKNLIDIALISGKRLQTTDIILKEFNLTKTMNLEKIKQNYSKLNPNHPVFSAIDKKLLKAKEDKKISDISKYPNIKVQASWIRIDELPQYKRNQDAFSIGLSLNIPIFRKKYQAFENKAFLSQQKAILEMKDQKDKYVSKIESAWKDIESSKESIQIFEKALIPQLSQKTDLNKVFYRLGSDSIVKIIDNLEDEIGIQKLYLKEQFRLIKAKIELEKLLGIDIKA